MCIFLWIVPMTIRYSINRYSLYFDFQIKIVYVFGSRRRRRASSESVEVEWHIRPGRSVLFSYGVLSLRLCSGGTERCSSQQGFISPAKHLLWTPQTNIFLTKSARKMTEIGQLFFRQLKVLPTKMQQMFLKLSEKLNCSSNFCRN